MIPLSSFTLLNTRPAQQAQALQQQLSSQGVRVLNSPTIAIERLDAQPTSAIIDIVIFTSVHAVHGYHRSQYALSLHQQVRFYAIGKATAEAMRQIGLGVVSLASERYDSESLLQDPALIDVSELNICIVKGRGGREQLKTVLSQRGAQLFEWVLYQRMTAEFEPKVWAEFVQADVPIILVSSLESFERLNEQLQAANLEPNWSEIRALLCFSQRIAQAIRPLVPNSLILEVVPTQSNAGIAQALQHLSTKLPL